MKDYFIDLDHHWKPVGLEPIRLPIIGSAALFLQCDYGRGARDSDVWQVGALTSEPIVQQLSDIAGPNSALAKRHRLYLDLVLAPIPFLPRPPLFHLNEKLYHQLKHFHVEVLDVTDVIVSKLKPFRPQDIEDIHYLATHGMIGPVKLVERFISTVDGWSMDARASSLPRIVENLHTIQRDLLGVEETFIELPRWISD